MQKTNKNKTTKMMAILMGTYYGFFLPQIINTYLDYDQITKEYISIIFFLLFFLNAIVNALIYAWMSPDFNRAFRNLLRIKAKNGQETNRRNIVQRKSSISITKSSASLHI